MRSKKVVPTRFEPETVFEARLVPAVPFRERADNELEGLKRRLLTEQLEELWESSVSSEIQRAADEAAAAAWVTPYPLLVFPILFEEKAATALQRAARQETVLRVSRDLLAV